MEILIVLGLFIVLILLNVPVGPSMLIASMIGLALTGQAPFGGIAQSLFYSIKPFGFIAVLFFILAGDIMSKGVLSRRLIGVVNSVVGNVTGGLGIACIISCALFGSISGSTLATLVAIGTIMVPAMKDANYPEGIAIGVTTASSILGIIVPPSIPMIVFALVANVSITKLFLAGFLPSALIAGLFSFYIFSIAKRNRVKSTHSFSFRMVISSLRQGWWALVMPLIIFGGIYGGALTPTEAAVTAAVYALMVEMILHKGSAVNMFKRFKNIFLGSGITSASILMLVAGGYTLGIFLTLERVPVLLSEYMGHFISSKVTFLLVMNLLLLCVGMMMDVISATLILGPILTPIAMQYGIDPVHFGIIFIVNLGIGFITPPYGASLFVAKHIFNLDFVTLIKSVTPFIILLLVALVLICYFPMFAMLLPNLMSGI